MTQPPQNNGGSLAVDDGMTVSLQPLHLKIYRLTEDKLDNLYTAGNYKNLDVALFGVAIGAFISLVVTVMTVEIKTAAMSGGFTAGIIISAIGAVYFGIRGVIAWRDAKRQFADIKRGYSEA